MAAIISIIIPVHNSLAYTRDALKLLKSALHRLKDPTWIFQIVVVDDGSDDGTSNWIKEHHPDIHLLPGDGNLWWSGAINRGMEFSAEALKADYILWWNNDIYPAEDYFLNLISLIGNVTEPMVYGSKIYMAENPATIWSYGGYFHRRWGHSYMPEMGKPDRPELNTPREADWLAGMGTILPVSIAKIVGSLNQKNFPQYHGDIDYTRRVKLAGYRVEVRPELKIWNHTKHSGLTNTDQAGKLISGLRRKNSIHNFRREWLLYRKYARTPLAFIMLFKKYIAYLLRGK